MKLIDGETLLNDIKSHVDYSPEDDYDEGWNDAISKIEVLKELAEQIPKTFLVRWENIL